MGENKLGVENDWRDGVVEMVLEMVVGIADGLMLEQTHAAVFRAYRGSHEMTKTMMMTAILRAARDSVVIC